MNKYLIYSKKKKIKIKIIIYVLKKLLYIIIFNFKYIIYLKGLKILQFKY